jgi:RNA polymerase sigma-70 factor, ECF subfamily
VTDFKKHIEKAKQGDEEAFNFLYAELYTPVFKYTLSRTRHRETAEDITSEVFLKFYGALERYELTTESPLSYLFTISKNLIINHGKKKKSSNFEEGEEYNIPSDNKTQLESAIESEEVGMILELMNELEETQAEVIRLKFLSDLSTKEVAETLQKTEANIRQLESRALRKIREKINERYV